MKEVTCELPEDLYVLALPAAVVSAEELERLGVDGDVASLAAVTTDPRPRLCYVESRDGMMCLESRVDIERPLVARGRILVATLRGQDNGTRPKLETIRSQ